MTRVSLGFLDYQRYAKMERAREERRGGWFVIFRGRELATFTMRSLRDTYGTMSVGR